MEKKDIINYFNRKKNISFWLFLFFGVIVLNVGVSARNGFTWIILGVIIICSSITLIYKKGKRINDKNLDDFCETIALKYKNENLRELGKEDMFSICKDGYCFENRFSTRKAIVGKDGVMRTTVFEMINLYIDDERGYYFDKKISLISDEKVEIKKSFLLKEVIMVSQKTVNNIFYVEIVIPGNETLPIRCKNMEEINQIISVIKGKSNL